MPSAPPAVQKELNRAPFVAFCVARSSRIWLEFVEEAWETSCIHSAHPRNNKPALHYRHSSYYMDLFWKADVVE
jgi:hypothetical protein